MTIAEMMLALQEALDTGLPGDTQVIIGDQPNYPFGCSISAWCIDHTFTQDFDRFTGSEQLDPKSVVVFCEGRQLAYGNKAWWDGQDIEPETEEDEDSHYRFSCESQTDNFEPD